MDRQQQERSEALAREQMNDQREMKALDQIVKSGQMYFNAMKASDDRELAFAQMQHKQQLAAQKESRDRQQHDMDQLQKWNQMGFTQGMIGARQEDSQVHSKEVIDYPYEQGYKQPEETHAQKLKRARAGATRINTASPSQMDVMKNRRVAAYGRTIGALEKVLEDRQAVLRGAIGDRGKKKDLDAKTKGALKKELDEIAAFKKYLAGSESEVSQNLSLSMPELENLIAEKAKKLNEWATGPAKAYFGAGGTGTGTGTDGSSMKARIKAAIEGKGKGGKPEAPTMQPDPGQASIPEQPQTIEQSRSYSAILFLPC